MKEQLISWSISTEPLPGICQSPAVWGKFAKNTMEEPLIYLKKSKWLSDGSFTEIIKHIKLLIPEGFEVEWNG